MYLRLFFLLGISILSLVITGCGDSSPPKIPTPSLASSSEIRAAQQFQPIDGKANVYVGISDEGMMFTYPMLSVQPQGQDFQQIGSLATKWYHNFSVSPGQYRFRIAFDDHIGQYLLSEFDLIIEESTDFVFIDCSKSLGNFYYHRDDGPVLRRFEDACPAGVDLVDGIGACQVPYTEERTSLEAITDEGEYLGACTLETNPDIYNDSKLARNLTDTITSIDYELARAEQANSIEGWQQFANYARTTEYRQLAEQKIAEIQAQQEYMAWEGRIQAILDRDSALPLQAQRDKYMIALTDYLQNQDFEPSLIYFELLNRLDIELSDSITHFWGEALLRTGNPQGALQKLYAYINMAGTSGTYYRDALMLINEAEAAIDAMPAEPVEEVASPASATGHIKGKAL